MRFFHPSAPPQPYWKHFDNRYDAMAYCEAAWPFDEDTGLVSTPHWKLPDVVAQLNQIPADDPVCSAGRDRAYAAVCALTPKEYRGQLVKIGRRTKYQELPPIVIACAMDVAQAAAQLYQATQTGVLYNERVAKWEPIAHGYGCLGYYSAQAVTYEPPPELDGRLHSRPLGPLGE